MTKKAKMKCNPHGLIRDETFTKRGFSLRRISIHSRSTLKAESVAPDGT